jgi:hypothetical protein
VPTTILPLPAHRKGNGGPTQGPPLSFSSKLFVIIVVDLQVQRPVAPGVPSWAVGRLVAAGKNLRSHMPVASAVVRMRSAPASTVGAAPREIAAELAAHVFIVPVTVAIVTVHPHIPPPVAMIPRRSIPARSMCMVTMLGPTDTPHTGFCIQVGCGHGKRRRSERRLSGAGTGQCLSYNGWCGQREKREQSERRQNFGHNRFPQLAGKARPEPSTARTTSTVTAKTPTWLQKWWHAAWGPNPFCASSPIGTHQNRLFRRR